MCHVPVRVSNAQALSVKGKRGITPKVLMSELCTFSMIISFITLWSKIRLHYNSKTGVIICTRKIKQRGITPKILMLELWTLYMTLLLTKVYLYILKRKRNA